MKHANAIVASLQLFLNTKPPDFLKYIGNYRSSVNLDYDATRIYKNPNTTTRATINHPNNSSRKCQDYVYLKWEY